jgi:hypothetical protein
MENSKTLDNVQIDNIDLLSLRLRKIHRTQNWLAKELGVNKSYVSQLFNKLGYFHLYERAETRISREERKIKERNEQKQVA